MTIVETWLERNTQLVKYKKGWNGMSSFISISLTFLGVRMVIGMVRYFSNKQQHRSKEIMYESDQQRVNK
jgi:hypothetical protein